MKKKRDLTENTVALTLADAKDGQWLIIKELTDETVSIQAIRFGINCGTKVQVQKNIAKGPVIISKKHVEIAIGRDLAKGVKVEPTDTGSS
ncbi:MAG: ferrous iron transport protein A [Candidatus Obscuribacterales bacterium]|nr:ferrous iron transport protein A [Candidatus Obscuribacterales bacterium]